MRRQNQVSNDVIYELRSQGLNFYQIADKVGMSYSGIRGRFVKAKPRGNAKRGDAFIPESNRLMLKLLKLKWKKGNVKWT